MAVLTIIVEKMRTFHLRYQRFRGKEERGQGNDESKEDVDLLMSVDTNKFFLYLKRANEMNAFLGKVIK
jgi:hypothetical protein